MIPFWTGALHMALQDVKKLQKTTHCLCCSNDRGPAEKRAKGALSILKNHLFR